MALTLARIDHIVLRVHRLEPMLHFYCSVLGCRIERRQDELGLVQLRAGASLVDLVSADGKLGRQGGTPPALDPAAGGRNLDHVCFRVDNFDAAAIAVHLASAGIAAGNIESRYGAEGEGPSLYLHDPEGNTIELKGPPSPLA